MLVASFHLGKQIKCDHVLFINYVINTTKWLYLSLKSLTTSLADMHIIIQNSKYKY